MASIEEKSVFISNRWIESSLCVNKNIKIGKITIVNILILIKIKDNT